MKVFLMLIQTKLQGIERTETVNKVFACVNNVEAILAIEHIWNLLHAIHVLLNLSTLQALWKRGIVNENELPSLEATLYIFDFIMSHPA